MTTSKSTDFTHNVLSLLKRIPKGRVTTYKEIASALGKPKACRAVGNVLNKNAFPDRFPCYRVVKSDGSLGGYSLGYEKKLQKLRHNGVKVKNGRIDLKKHFFRLKESNF